MSDTEQIAVYFRDDSPEYHEFLAIADDIGVPKEDLMGYVIAREFEERFPKMDYSMPRNLRNNWDKIDEHFT